MGVAKSSLKQRLMMRARRKPVTDPAEQDVNEAAQALLIALEACHQKLSSAETEVCSARKAVIEAAQFSVAQCYQTACTLKDNRALRRAFFKVVGEPANTRICIIPISILFDQIVKLAINPDNSNKQKVASKWRLALATLWRRKIDPHDALIEIQKLGIERLARSNTISRGKTGSAASNDQITRPHATIVAASLKKLKKATHRVGAGQRLRLTVQILEDGLIEIVKIRRIQESSSF